MEKQERYIWETSLPLEDTKFSWQEQKLEIENISNFHLSLWTAAIVGHRQNS